MYQQQREQLQKRYQEKDEIIQQLTVERDHLQVNSSVIRSKMFYWFLQKKISELSREALNGKKRMKSPEKFISECANDFF